MTIWAEVSPKLLEHLLAEVTAVHEEQDAVGAGEGRPVTYFADFSSTYPARSPAAGVKGGC
jgi:hypothetical protein